MVMHHTTSRVGPTGVTSRILLTVVGAAGLIVGAFLNWTRDLQGTHVSWRSVYQDTFGSTDNIVQSIGGASILVGLIAVLGLADASGWLVRFAGAVGIVGSVLFIIQVQRSSDHSLQTGLWFALVGSVLCVAAGLTGYRGGTVIVDE
ncbi:sugar:proton symporter [Catenulispora subtropica]|uniref:Integral membrane protein n=1 Tax=Catenulispora subtropica TaxID=450798 RepID=A0ABP5EQ61_9ACTN